MKHFEVIGYHTEDGGSYCADHAPDDTTRPVFAGDECADEHHCDECVALEVAEREQARPVMQYLATHRITGYRETPIPRHRRRQDGYGTLVPGAHMLQLDGKRWYRVRTACWGNAGTDFVRVNGQQLALATGWLIRWGQHELATAYMRHLDARIAGTAG